MVGGVCSENKFFFPQFDICYINIFVPFYLVQVIYYLVFPLQLTYMGIQKKTDFSAETWRLSIDPS